MSTKVLRIAFAAFLAAVLFVSAQSAVAGTIAITEWMYSPSSGSPAEYIELTNVSYAPVDVTGWSQDDSNRIAGKHAFGDAFGVIQPGESVILCEASDPVGFRTFWGLDSSVKVYGYGTSDSLGRSDEINIYDASNNLVDRLTYNDQGGLGPRTQGVGGNIPLAYLWQNDPNHAVLSTASDLYGSHRGASGTDTGNPGVYTPFTAPEPGTFALLAAAALAMLAYRRSGR